MGGITRRFKTQSRCNGYRMVLVDGKKRKRSHMVWNFHHPDNPVKKGEVIHHRDGNKRNDRLYNLRKMKKRDHDKLHALENQPLKKWRKENPDLASKHGRANSKALRLFHKDHPKVNKKSWQRLMKWREENPEAYATAQKKAMERSIKTRRRLSEERRAANG